MCSYIHGPAARVQGACKRGRASLQRVICPARQARMQQDAYTHTRDCVCDDTTAQARMQSMEKSEVLSTRRV